MPNPTNIPAQMRAVQYHNYGPPEVLKPGTASTPQPKEKELLVRIHCATVTAGDCELLSFDLPYKWLWLPLRLAMGWKRPRYPILGMEFAGEVVGMGAAVTNYKVGDRVFGDTNFGFGAYAEFACFPEAHQLGRIPEGMSYEDAASIPVGGCNGLHFIRKAKLKPGQHILINGAGGSIGTYALQLAKQQGAIITAIDNGPKLDMLRSIGADHVIDYTKEDFTYRGQTYDVILDVVGKAPYSRSMRCLNKGGRLIVASPGLHHMLRAPFTRLFSNKRCIITFAGTTTKDLELLAQQQLEGTLRPVIDKRIQLEEIPEAHRYVEANKKAGILIVNI